MADQVLVEVKDRVMWIRMNRPEKKNALTGAMYTAMSDAITQAGNDAAVRAILITGTQDCFTAGNDLVDFANAKPGGPSPAIIFLQTISTSQKPVIAAVSGVAVGIGTTMLLHCDLVYAGTSAKFHLPFVNLGLCAEGGSSLILPAMLGQHRAAELLLFGDPFRPGDGQRIRHREPDFPRRGPVGVSRRQSPATRGEASGSPACNQSFAQTPHGSCTGGNNTARGPAIRGPAARRGSA